jgi:hypothetical protein
LWAWHSLQTGRSRIALRPDDPLFALRARVESGGFKAREEAGPAAKKDTHHDGEDKCTDLHLDGYVKAATGQEQMGDLAGARERHRLIAQLKQLRSEMLLLAEAEHQGNWTPSWRQAPSSLPAASACT